MPLVPCYSSDGVVHVNSVGVGATSPKAAGKE